MRFHNLLYMEIARKSGNCPSFSDIAKPELAIPLYEYFVEECKKNSYCTNWHFSVVI